jgi:hypothetical protein
VFWRREVVRFMALCWCHAGEVEARVPGVRSTPPMTDTSIMVHQSCVRNKSRRKGVDNDQNGQCEKGNHVKPAFGTPRASA